MATIRHRDPMGRVAAWTEADFWARIVPEPNTGCWLYLGPYDKDGYGKFGALGERAHRIAWTLTRGPVPHGKWVLHRCDTEPCVNPGHLFLGDNALNVDDRTAKGRSQRGIAHGRAKIDDGDVREIRRRYFAGDRQRDLAVEFGISKTQIARIVHEESWGHVS